MKELSTDKEKLYSAIRKLNDEIIYFEKYAIEYSFKIEVWDFFNTIYLFFYAVMFLLPITKAMKIKLNKYYQISKW